MRVLISAITYHPTVGGADDFIRSIAEGLVERGHTVRVVASDLLQHVSGEKLEATETRRLNGVEIVRCPSMRIPGHLYPFWPSFFARVREFEPDLVHGFGLGYWSADAAGRLARRLPVVISPTGGRYRSGRLYGLLRAFLLSRTEEAPIWTALSESEKTSLREEHSSVRRIEILSPSIRREEWGKERRDPFPTIPKGNRIFYAGRLSTEKGLGDLFRALHIVRRSIDAHLIVTGPDCGFGRPPKWEGIHDAGILDREKLIAAYQHTDLLVLPSSHEGFGIVLVEAMAAGKPVIAYDNTSMPELCRDGENGLLVSTGDVEALAAAIWKILGSPALRDRFGAAGRARALGEFARERMLDKLLKEIYPAARG
jgi:glycosyltransferase involved in cell wall biosynthesis